MASIAALCCQAHYGLIHGSKFFNTGLFPASFGIYFSLVHCLYNNRQLLLTLMTGNRKEEGRVCTVLFIVLQKKPDAQQEQSLSEPKNAKLVLGFKPGLLVQNATAQPLAPPPRPAWFKGCLLLLISFHIYPLELLFIQGWRNEWESELLTSPPSFFLFENLIWAAEKNDSHRKMSLFTLKLQKINQSSVSGTESSVFTFRSFDDKFMLVTLTTATTLTAIATLTVTATATMLVPALLKASTPFGGTKHGIRPLETIDSFTTTHL